VWASVSSLSDSATPFLQHNRTTAVSEEYPPTKTVAGIKTMEFLRPQVRNFLPASGRFLALFANLCIVGLAKSFVRRSGTRSAGFFGLAPFFEVFDSDKRRNMRKANRLTAFVTFASALAYAETWTGKLVDANCAEHDLKHFD
jgi:hypothetical protein